MLSTWSEVLDNSNRDPLAIFPEIFSERTEMAELLRLRQYSWLVIHVLQSCVSLNLVLIGGGEWFTVSDQALD